MALTKADLAKHLLVVGGLNLSKEDAIAIVEEFFEEIRLALINGEEVKISGFGNFRTRDKKQRPGRNPKTGKEVAISARRVVTFHAGQKLKVRIDELAGVKLRGNSENE